MPQVLTPVTARLGWQQGPLHWKTASFAPTGRLLWLMLDPHGHLLSSGSVAQYIVMHLPLGLCQHLALFLLTACIRPLPLYKGSANVQEKKKKKKIYNIYNIYYIIYIISVSLTLVPHPKAGVLTVYSGHRSESERIP